VLVVVSTRAVEAFVKLSHLCRLLRFWMANGQIDVVFLFLSFFFLDLLSSRIHLRLAARFHEKFVVVDANNEVRVFIVTPPI
jgi:hypothetical protein